MPDRLTDLTTPQPNVVLEAYRRQIVASLAGVDDSYWLAGLLSELLDTALTSLDELRADMAALTARVDALTPPVEDPL